MDVLTEIGVERDRQITEEGWTPEHDDEYVHKELARAAHCYAFPVPFNGGPPHNWPWDDSHWKPGDYKRNANDYRRNLVKAGALIVAEIERLDRVR